MLGAMTSGPAPTLVLGIAVAFLCGTAAGYLLAPRGDAERAELPDKAMPAAESVTRPPPEEQFSAAAHGVQSSSQREDGDVTAAMLGAARSRDYFRRRHDLYELGERLGPAELASAMTAAEAFPGPDRDLVQTPLLSAWLCARTRMAQWRGSMRCLRAAIVFLC